MTLWRELLCSAALVAGLADMTMHLRVEERTVREALRARGWLPPELRTADLPADIYPGRPALTLWSDGQSVQPAIMRWGVPPFEGKRVIAHAANLASLFWRPWLKPPWRAVVPATAFAEWSAADTRSHWFAPAEGEVLWLAALWRPTSGKRQITTPTAEDPPTFALVNAPANRTVAPHHPDSMPTLLKEKEIDTWLQAPREIAMELKRPFHAAGLKEVV